MSGTLQCSDSVTMTNEKGTGEDDCPCGSWIEHWSNHSGVSGVITCFVLGCKKVATDGAHVTLDHVAKKSGGFRTFIAPMCHEHNCQFGQDFQAKPNSVFVRVGSD
ncbi:hypothetical protein KIF53_09430 [Chromobacterium subtsugae]|uniref:CENP-V/GFA domain-containing protein n=1 Tax=Chromobacterium subtsugae TaxID=251747 RepID=A0ABS7FEV4_9NEIS|nr:MULTISPECIES: hypothetical protein [Chromobacterium]MBW7566297.1 hypothetical protein [Chromobacterium subtsugae]MBW8287844.1 hypothetical protein [Chromobacterium subtsugae]WSE91173.1 hypothetical protein U6115_20215 [Chromobacterium subtsugae]WVH59548.1 hypothetical protein U6151_20245 [Chromobacterium subtsugae]